MKRPTKAQASTVLRTLISVLLLTVLILVVRHVVRAQGGPPGPSDPTDAERQELNGLYAAAVSATESLAPGPDTPAKREEIAEALEGELEDFVASHSNSVWTPGVRLDLARRAQLHSAYLRAMDHYQRVWDAVKGSTNAEVMQMGREASGGLARLLALTGRMSELNALEADVRANNGVAASSDWAWAKEMQVWASRHPAESYKCGLYCLDQLGRLTQPGQFLPKDITETPSSTNGFTLAQLVQIGARAGLHVQADLLNDPTNIPVPSVLHLRSEHFVVVRERRGAFYEVYDPLAYGYRWLTANEIAGEATGAVIVNDSTASTGTVSLTALDLVAAGSYRGRCHNPYPYDHNDDGCTNNQCPPCHGSAGGGGGGGSGGGGLGGGGRGGGFGAGGNGGSAGANTATPCSSCGGMPAWSVSEAYLNLWVQDTPLWYHRAYGPAVSLHLAYHDRNYPSVVSGYMWQGAQISDASYGVWACSWLSFAELNSSENLVDLALPGGGWATFNFPSGSNSSDIEYHHNLWLEKLGPTGGVTNLVLHYPDGSSDTYGILDTNTAASEGFAGLYYLSAETDSSGNSVTFSYDGSYYLTNVTAADGTEFTLHYDNPNRPSYITSVTASYGASVSFSHDDAYHNDAGILLGLTDAAGITSQFSYEEDNYGGPIVQLVTPYGTTSFSTLNADQFNNGITMFDRIVRITQADGTQEFYAQLNDVRQI